jgi:hypothetical protein
MDWKETPSGKNAGIDKNGKIGKSGKSGTSGKTIKDVIPGLSEYPARPTEEGSFDRPFAEYVHTSDNGSFSGNRVHPPRSTDPESQSPDTASGNGNSPSPSKHATLIRGGTNPLLSMAGAGSDTDSSTNGNGIFSSMSGKAQGGAHIASMVPFSHPMNHDQLLHHAHHPHLHNPGSVTGGQKRLDPNREVDRDEAGL